MDRGKKSHRRAMSKGIKERKKPVSEKSDIYRPSQAEQKLLDVVLRPENFHLNVTKICQVAEISRETFYSSMKKPEFRHLLRKETFNLIDPALPSVVNRFILEAKRGSYQHGKVVLEIGNVYTPKAKFEGALSTMDTAEALIEKLKANPESLTDDERERLGRLTGCTCDGEFSLHLLLIEWMRKSEQGVDTKDDWRFLLLSKPVREIVENAERDDEISKHLPELKEIDEKEKKERGEKNGRVSQTKKSKKRKDVETSEGDKKAVSKNAKTLSSPGGIGTEGTDKAKEPQSKVKKELGIIIGK